MTPSARWKWTQASEADLWRGTFDGVDCRVILLPEGGPYLLYIGGEATPRRYAYLPGDADMEGEIERYRRRQQVRAKRAKRGRP